MSSPIDFWFDFSSPYAYIASELIDSLGAQYGRSVVWRPMLLGVAFKSTGTVPLISVPLKGDYCRRDFDRSARYHGLPFRFPQVFPALTLAAGRAYYWLADQDAAQARRFAHGMFRAYWAQDRNIGELDVVLDVAGKVGLDTAALARAIAAPEVKERFKRETESAISQGIFGAPYFIVDGEPFWGADRLPQLEHWLATGGF